MPNVDEITIMPDGTVMVRRRKKKVVAQQFMVPTKGAVTPMTAITAVTTGAGQTLTLQQITPTGGSCTVLWGDGATSTIADGNTGTTTHEYAAAGTYQVTITNPHLLTAINLRDEKIIFNSANVGGIVPGNLTILALRMTLNSGSTFDSADFSGATPSDSLYLYFTQDGTYTFDSSHFAGATPSTDLYFVFTQDGTYIFDSSHFAGATPSSFLGTYLLKAGTYTFDSSHFAGAQPGSFLYFNIHNSVTTTIARADWTGIARNVVSPTIQLGLEAGEVDLVLLGIYDDFANRTAVNGTLNVAGNNAAPTGTLQAQCAPTTGKEAAYELVNDSCGVSSNHYAAVTITA